MVFKDIKYIDANGEEKTRRCYFHLSEIEQTRIDAKYSQGYADLAEYIKDIVDRHQKVAIIDVLEDIILTAYGVRSSDNQGFTKTPAIREEFSNSFAYAQFFVDLTNNPDDFKAFITKVMEKNQKTDSVQVL